jgi:hypothetical protein
VFAKAALMCQAGSYRPTASGGNHFINLDRYVGANVAHRYEPLNDLELRKRRSRNG